MLDFLYRVMKLKLEAKGGVTILGVTEDVGAQHVPVLKAGLTKLFESGKKAVLLDVAGAVGMAPSVLAEIIGIQNIAADHGAQLMIVSPTPGIGNASSRDEALGLMTSPIGNLMAEEARLSAKLSRLTKRKTELENALASTAATEKDIKRLRKENSDLKTLVGGLERQLERLLRERIPKGAELPSLASKRMTIEKTATVVLEVSGVLQV